LVTAKVEVAWSPTALTMVIDPVSARAASAGAAAQAVSSTISSSRRIG
jgi:hypothetical protein